MEYILHLGKDKRLKKLLDQHAPFSLKKRSDIPVYHGDRSPSPEEVLATPVTTLRSIGLSNAKAGYVFNVARFALEEGLDGRMLNKMNDEEVMAHLIKIKGVGRWTVEMLLMFGLGREDIFSIDDWGIQNAMIRLYKLDRTDKKTFREKILRISGKWSPYRTYACLHLWHWKDNIPVSNKLPTPAKSKKALRKK